MRTCLLRSFRRNIIGRTNRRFVILLICVFASTLFLVVNVTNSKFSLLPTLISGLDLAQLFNKGILFCVDRKSLVRERRLNMTVFNVTLSRARTLKDAFENVSAPFLQREHPTPCPPSGSYGVTLWERDGFRNLTYWQNSLKTDPDGFIRNLSSKSDPRMSGGAWRPSTCSTNKTVAIIIPYRNREKNLKVLLNVLHPFLQRFRLDYQIFVVEQSGNPDKLFNKGILYNSGFRVVRALRPDIDCLILHDVDLVPEDERMQYGCNATSPFHLSAWVDTLDYGKVYEIMVGGVLAMTKEQFEKVNGYPRCYWGWGGEDDDMGKRIKAQGYKIHREPEWFRYTMMNHASRLKEKDETDRYRFALVRSAHRRFHHDGLNSVKSDVDGIEAVVVANDFVHVIVDVGTEGHPKNNRLLSMGRRKRRMG